MNRLLLIGNGFDLAHGLKTGYNDFILWYLKKSFLIAYENLEYKDEFLTINRRFREKEIHLGRDSYSVEELIDFYYEKGFDDLINNKDIKIEGWLNTYDAPFHIAVHSTLFLNLLLNCSRCQWVEIENEFYEQLKQVLKGNQTVNKGNVLKELNESLRVLILKLEEYLTTIQPTHLTQDYSSIFESPIIAKDIVSEPHFINDEQPEDSLILNFNYTSTAEHYFVSNQFNLSPKRIKVNYIHGKLNTPSNPIIFGFGDELDESYLKMELERTKGFFEYIKSFWYFKTSNYHNLIRFIDEKSFQVFILGHSCGLSDRTMLNMIFEHENCKSIKIFYYGQKDGVNNFKPLTEEILKAFQE